MSTTKLELNIALIEPLVSWSLSVHHCGSAKSAKGFPATYITVMIIIGCVQISRDFFEWLDVTNEVRIYPIINELFLCHYKVYWPLSSSINIILFFEMKVW